MTTKKLLMASFGAALMLTACDVKDPIYEAWLTDHPEHGKITLTTDWSNIGTGLAAPSSYTVQVGDYWATLTGTTNTINNLFDPGSYTAYVWNTADNIAVSGTTATADYTAGTLGWFFTSKLAETIEADTDHQFTAVMAQQVRQLTLVIEPSGGTADQIATITGTLSGVAGTYDFDTDAHGSATDVAQTFTKQTSGDHAGKWTATVRLLGVTGTEQKLTGTITFTGGAPGNMALESDLTSALSTFNDKKTEPLALGGTAVETPTGVGFTATITGWNPVTGGSVIAN